MKTKLDNLIDEIQRGKPGPDTVAAEMRSPFRDEFEQPVNGWMVERQNDTQADERERILISAHKFARGIPPSKEIEGTWVGTDTDDLVDTTKPISSDDNYKTNNIKIDPEVVYEAIRDSMRDVQDVVECGEVDSTGSIADYISGKYHVYEYLDHITVLDTEKSELIRWESHGCSCGSLFDSFKTEFYGGTISAIRKSFRKYEEHSSKI